MEWQDIGLVIGTRKYGETSVILEVMTRSRGRCLGVVRGGRSGAQRAILQSGNRIKATWRARLEEQLGAFVIDPIDLRAARFLDSGPTLHGLATLVSLMRLLPERDPHENLFELAEEIIVEFCVRNSAAVKMARFELALLSALGYGLDLRACVLTGDKEDLAYVSPKSGRVVSRSAGAPWRDRLLPYPAFLQNIDEGASFEDVSGAFRLTGYFLVRDVLAPRGVTLPSSRALYIDALSRLAA